MDYQEQQSVRADIYLLLATLLKQAPSQELLDLLVALETEQDEGAMHHAWVVLREAASVAKPAILAEEYQDLFIGIGCGEVVPYGSWHTTGSLMEKPLALIRQDLQELGYERQDDVKEPEDHIAALCEVMGMLVEAECEPVQRDFFNKHIGRWFGSLTSQIAEAPSAQFYAAVGQLLNAFLSFEQVRFSESKTEPRNKLKIDVKNVTDRPQA